MQSHSQFQAENHFFFRVGGGNMIRAKVVTFVVLFLAIIVFMMQNVQSVTIRFLIFQQSVPLIGVICILALVGFVMGYLTAVMGARRKGKKQK